MSDVLALNLIWSQSMEIVERIGWLLVHSLWQFAAIVLLAFLLDRFLRGASAAIRYRTLLTAMLLIVIAPIGTWQCLPPAARPHATLSQTPPPSPELARERREPSGDGGESAVVDEERGGLQRNASIATAPRVTVVPTIRASEPPAKPRWAIFTDAVHPWLPLIVCVWGVGVLLFSIRPLWSWCVVRRLRTVGVSPVEQAVQQTLDRVSERMKIARRICVLQSTLVNAPVVVGCFRGVILLPASFIAGVPVSQLEAIFAHELAHVRRYDYLVNLLQTLVETLFFYHPAVWWLSRRIRVERENCCDDLAVAALDNRVEYGRALLAIEELRGAAASSLALSARDGSLLARVRRLFADPARDDQRSSAGLAALLVIASALLVTVLWMATRSEADDNPSAIEFGTASHGLQARIVSLRPGVNDHLPDLGAVASEFERSEDMTFGIELKNVSDKPILLAGVRRGGKTVGSRREGLQTARLAPCLFEFDFTDAQGRAVPRPERRYYQAWLMLLPASVHELAPGQSLIEVLRPARFNSPMDFDLPPGKYRLRVSYHGLSAEDRGHIEERAPDYAVLKTWAHSVESNATEFSITNATRRASQDSLVWGPENGGLQAAIEYRIADEVTGDPSQPPGVAIGNHIGVVFHVRNVSDKVITFVSETLRQGDTVHVTDERDQKVDVKDVWFSGWPIDVAWRLQPGEVARLNLLSPSLDSINRPGRYNVRYTIRFNSRTQKDAEGNTIFPRPDDYNQELDTGQTPLFLTTPQKDTAIDDTPFRLPDHWIIEDVRWLDGDQELLTASIQGGVNIRRWDVGRRRLLSEIKLASDQHGRPIRQGTNRLSVDGNRAIAVTDGYVGVWDTSSGEWLRQLPIPQKQWEYDTVHCLDCSEDGSVIVGGLGTRYSRTTMSYPSYGIAWDARSGAVLCTFEQQGGYDVCDVAVASDGRRFATCSAGNRVCLWETATGKLLADYSALAHDWKSPEPAVINNHLVRGIDLSPDGWLLAMVGTYGIRLIDVTSGKLLRTIDAPVSIGHGDVVFSADGKYLARFGSRRTRQDQDSVLTWSVETGEQLSELVTPATIARFSRSGRQLAAGDSDFYEAISIWPMAGAKKLGPLPPPEKTARIDRVEENTHRRGASAAEFVRRWKLGWGPEQNGLQYGIALTSEGKMFRIGQRVAMVVFLKNTSERTLQFDFRPDMFGNPPRVTSVDGKPVELAKRNLVGRVAHYRDKLEPGELFGPLYLNFGLGSNPQPGMQEWTPHLAVATPGVYEVTHRAPIHIADAEATGDVTGPDWLQVTLETGSIEFQVVSGNDQGAALDKVEPRPFLPQLATWGVGLHQNGFLTEAQKLAKLTGRAAHRW